MEDLIRQRMVNAEDFRKSWVKDHRTLYGTHYADEEINPNDITLCGVMFTALAIGAGCFFAMLLWAAMPGCIPL